MKKNFHLYLISPIEPSVTQGQGMKKVGLWLQTTNRNSLGLFSLMEGGRKELYL